MNKIFNISGALLLTAILLLTAACSSDSSNDVQPSPTPNTSQEISLIPTVWQMAEATRATMLDNDYLQNNGFICTAYDAGTNTVNGSANINKNHVTWENSRWNFTGGARNWPATGDLDFFAYTPTTRPSYITDIIYAVNGTPAAAPYFTCRDLPLALTPTDDTQEFIWALTTGQNRVNQGESGVTMTFKHPFARVKFKLSATSSSNVTATSIMIGDIFRDGTCTLTGTGNAAVSTWSNLSDGTSNLTITGSPATNDDAFYLVIPNNYGSKTLSVAITWREWDVEHTQTLTTPLDINWAAGTSYTYSLTITKNDLKVDINKFTEQW